MKYRLNSGGSADFDVSPQALKKYGFAFKEKVRTPKGPATVIGVHEDKLWFHVDTDPGASYWGSCKTQAQFVRMGFRKDGSDVLEYKAKAGETLEFDIGDNACSAFGFLHGQRVDTPKGFATVIGVRGQHLWFHADCDTGASYWGSCKTKQDLRDKGFRLLKGKENSLPKYKARGGELLTFDTSKCACFPFGFLHNDRVHTTKGDATVVGVRNGTLWFHVDGEKGASYWKSCLCAQDFESMGFKKLNGFGSLKEFKLNAGGKALFDVSEKVFAQTGFYPGQKVSSPRGPATAIGLFEAEEDDGVKRLWLWVASDKGATYWGSCKYTADFIKKGFKPLEQPGESGAMDEDDSPMDVAQEPVHHFESSLSNHKEWKYMTNFKLLDLPSETRDYQFAFAQYIANTSPAFANEVLPKQIDLIWNQNLERLFEGQKVVLETRVGDNEAPRTWQDEPGSSHKMLMMKHLEYYSDRFQLGKKKVHMLPLWFATNMETALLVCNSGFGALHLDDEAPYGRGIYLTDSAEEAAKSVLHEHNPVLLLCWAVLGSVYPVMKGNAAKLKGKSKFKNHDCHLIPLVPDHSTQNPGLKYVPCDEGQIPYFNQFVLFNEAQLFPRFMISLETKGASSPVPVRLDAPPIQARNPDPKKWKCHEVIEWMSGLNLSKDYSSIVVQQALDGEILVDMTSKEDWLEFGVAALGDIRKLVKHTKDIASL